MYKIIRFSLVVALGCINCTQSLFSQALWEKLNKTTRNHLAASDSIYTLIQGDSIPGIWDKAAV
jgi:hypothetical protein